MKIGVIGLGMVGTAVADSFRKSDKFHLSSYDIKFEGSKIEAIRNTEVCFVCVSAPTNRDGTVNLGSIHMVLEQLVQMKFTGDVVIKSTLIPGTCLHLQHAYPEINIVHNPEFLRERCASFDFINQFSVLVSGRNTKRVESAYNLLMPKTPVISSQVYADTELAKYIHNTWLATQVVFMNEIHQYQKASGLFKDGSEINARAMACSQGKIAPTHVMVPGPDGGYGYGGSCFPKDVKAFLTHSSSVGAAQALLNMVSALNLKMRTNVKPPAQSQEA